MKSKYKNYTIGDVIIIRDSGGHYSTHPHRLSIKGLKKCNKDFLVENYRSFDKFPINKRVTIIGFQVLNQDDMCLIVRYSKKAYWISINSLRKPNKGNQKIIDIVNKTNPRRTKDILKRYWEE